MQKESEVKYEKLYLKKKRWKIKLILLAAFIILGFEFITILIKPSLIALCKVRSESLANSISGKAVQEVMSGLRIFGSNHFG